jgi:hypothetical protein
MTKGAFRCRCGDRRALIGKDEFEQAVRDGVRDHLHGFIATGGAEVLDALVIEAAKPRGDGEPALKERLQDRRRKLDDPIGCLTPALKETLEPRILALREEIEGIEADLARARQTRIDGAHARALVVDLVEDAGRVGALLDAAAPSDARDLLRAIVQEVVIDPDKGEGEVTFHAIPRLAGAAGAADESRPGPDESGGPGHPSNAERTPPRDARVSSHIQMAGARLVAQKRTCRVRIIRKPWLLRSSPRRVAV